MLYGYDIMHLYTEIELEETKPIDSVIVFFRVLGFSNLVLKDYRKAAIVSDALSKISEQFNSTNKVYTSKSIDGCDKSPIQMYSTIFSNSIILSCPVVEKNRLFIIKEVIRMVCDVQFHMFQEGILIRGGITIGDICHNEKYVFGKGVMEVMALESKVAMYPRIIFSDQLLNIIATELNKSILLNTDNFKYISENECFFEQYIQEDDDLVMYIDYIGVGLLTFLDIMGRDYISDFQIDFLDKINQYIEIGKESKALAIKKKYFWIEEKFSNKLNYLKT